MARNENISARFAELVDTFLDRRLSPAEAEELERLLEASEDARRYLTEMMSLDSLLLGELSAVEQVTGEEKIVAFPSPKTGGRSKSLRFALGIAAALVLTFLGLLQFSSPDDGAVAFVDRLEDALWGPESTFSELAYDSELAAGDVLDLRHGKAGITLTNGARLLISAPSVVVFQSDELVQLLDGEVAVTIPPHVVGFRVESPGYVVEAAPPGSQPHGNLYGIRFNARNNQLGTQVFEGDINVTRRANGYALKLAQARQANLEVGQVTANVDRRREFSVVLAPTPGHPVFHRDFSSGGGDFQVSKYVQKLGPGEVQLFAAPGRSVSARFLDREGDIVSTATDSGRFVLNHEAAEQVFALKMEDSAANGAVYLFRPDSSVRRSDFLGRWESASDPGNSVFRLRADGALELESGSFAALGIDPDVVGWMFRDGELRFFSKSGKVRASWNMMGREFLRGTNRESPVLRRAR